MGGGQATGGKLEYMRILARERAKKDLHFFAYWCCEFYDVDSDLHRDMARRWMERRWVQFSLWQVPRGHLKTSLWTLAGTLWELCNNPHLRFLIVNADKEKAEDIIKDIKIIVETHTIFRWLFPEYCWDLVPKEKANRCKVHTDRLDFPCSRFAGRREGNIECMGVEASLVSKHYDVFIYDDPVNEKNTTTRQYRNKIHKWYLDSLQLMHDPSESRVRIIGTNWHLDDLYCRIRRAEFKHREEQKKRGEKVRPGWWLYIRKVVEPHPNGRTIIGREKVAPIWPERFTPEVIEDLRSGPTGRGSYVFSCQYMNEPISPEDAVFRKEDIRIVPFFDIPEQLQHFMGVDLAISAKEESDYSAVIVVGFDDEGAGYVRQIFRRRMNPKEFLDIIWEMCQRWGVRGVAVEAVAFQQTVLSYYKQHCVRKGWNIPWVEMKRSQTSKEARFLAMQPRVERGDLCIEEGISGIEDLIDEMTTFSLDHLPPHDDLLDALADVERIFYRAPQMPSDPEPKDTYEAWYGKLDEDPVEGASWGSMQRLQSRLDGMLRA